MIKSGCFDGCFLIIITAIIFFGIMNSINALIITLVIITLFLLVILIDILNDKLKEKVNKNEQNAKIEPFLSDDRTGKLLYTHKENYIGVSVDYERDFIKKNNLSLLNFQISVKNKTFVTKNSPILKCDYGYNVSKNLYSDYEGLFVTEYEKNTITGYDIARIYPCTKEDAENLKMRLEEIDKKQGEIDEQNYKIEKERIEIEKIKRKMLEKERKKELEKQAEQELKNANLLN